MFTLKTPAKINWFLSVLGKREDGYHEISSLMQCVALYDYLSFELSERIEIRTDADIPLEENLVYRVANLMRENMSVNKGAAITLKKEIPVSAGLGGGSSDAACALIGLNRLWGLGMNEEELMEFGGMLGSDIPFFFKGPLAAVGGRGEIVTQLRAETPNVILLVKPDISVSTKWAYTEVSKLLRLETELLVVSTRNRELTKRDNNIKLFCQSLDKRDFASIVFMLKNDLEIPVIREFKVIDELKNRLLDNGALVSMMSGSGPTVFGVFDRKEKAEKAALSLKPNWCRVVETITTAQKSSRSDSSRRLASRSAEEQ